MVTLTFNWSWWAFALGALSLLVLEIVVMFWIAAVQYRKNKKAQKDVWSNLEQYVKKSK